MGEKLKIFVELTRLNKPIGFMLLFWPCLWGLTIAYDFSSQLKNYFFYMLLFLSGAILMRSAGCIVNDIVDTSNKNEYNARNDNNIKFRLMNYLFIFFQQ